MLFEFECEKCDSYWLYWVTWLFRYMQFVLCPLQEKVSLLPSNFFLWGEKINFKKLNTFPKLFLGIYM